MADKILNAFDVWITAQGVKSRTRLRSVDNISLEGVERLRELILNLAVSGKLSRQLSSDESATSLLNRIIAEKKKLVEQGLIKEPRTFGQIEEDERPYSLPTGWCWTRLGNIGIGSTGKTPSTNNSSLFGGEIPFIGPGQISNQGEILNSENTLTEEGSQYSTIANKGDILMVCIGGSIGKTAIVQSRVTFNQQVNCIRPIFVDSSYLNFVMNSGQFQAELLEKSTGSATPIINRGKWEELLVSLPPLAEQHRIVAKVDELMALCDALEQQETHHLKSHQLLVETLLGTLTRAADAKEFQHAWNKLYEHFDNLFTTEDSIDQLKQTILQLAVMGKLVPQDPNDEPASDILKQINERGPYEIPKNWAWVVLQQISTVGTGATPLTTNADYYNNGDIAWVTSSATNNLFIEESETFITKKALEETNCKVYPKGTLLVAMYGQGKTRGQVSELNIDAATNQACAAIELHLKDLGHRRYVKLFFQKIYLEIRELAEGGAQPNLNLGKVKETLIPFPPLAEQKRIVSKVDELFALCDRLKERIVEAQKVANQMAEGVGAMKESA